MYATRSRKKETGTGASRAGNRSKRFTVIELSKIQVFTEWYLNILRARKDRFKAVTRSINHIDIRLYH